MKTSDFDYELPPELIAQTPSNSRTSSRLLVDDEPLRHISFKDIHCEFESGDMLVMNNSAVINARLFGKKLSGGKVELLFERLIDKTCALMQIKASRAPKVGDEIILIKNNLSTVLKCKGREGIFFIIEFDDDPWTVLQEYGHIPLPPYINRVANLNDAERYKTVYENTKHIGSVAAPTAGLHFDENLLSTLEEQGVLLRWINLAVGSGTFQPVKVENIQDHVMHQEFVQVDKNLCEEIIEVRSSGKKIFCVGTTSLRAIESAFSKKPPSWNGLTDLFIYPGYQFRAVDALITNFHLPRSSLLMLVAAFIGIERLHFLYKTAIKKDYKFLSYGDAMLLRHHE